MRCETGKAVAALASSGLADHANLTLIKGSLLDPEA